MKNISKFINAGMVALLLSGMVAVAADYIVVADPTNPSNKKLSGIPVSSNQINGQTNITGVTSSAGAADAGKTPKLNGAGQLDLSFIPGGGGVSSLISTNITSFVFSPGGNPYINILSFTTTATNGNVVVTGDLAWAGFNGGGGTLRLRDSLTNVVAASTITDYGDGGNAWNRYCFHASLMDTLSGSAKTYYLDLAIFSTGTITNQAAASTGPAIVNQPMKISILQIP